MPHLLRCAQILALAGFALAATAAETNRRYALVIGIDDYEMLGKLDCARADAEALAAALVQNCGFDPDRICLVTDNAARAKEFQPTFTNVQRRIQYFTSAPEPGDSVLLYFAGHGLTFGGEGYLMPADGSDERSGVPMAWLRDRLNACKATNKILILDACHSGKLTRGVSGIAPTLATAPSVLVLASCKENQISYPEGGHGVFTAALLDGLGGKADRNQDKNLTGAELFSHVRDYIDKWSIRTAKIQTPQMTPADASGISVATISPRPVVAPKPVVPAVPAVPPPDPKLLLAKLYQSVADDLVRSDAAAAAKHAADAKADASLSAFGSDVANLALQVQRLGTVPDLVMGTFGRDKGKEVKAELRAGTETLLIGGVTGRSATAQRIIRTGSGSMQAACNFAYADLSYREKARRLAAAATGPDAALLQGMLALENRQAAPAKKLFADSATELGKALAARLTEAEAKAAVQTPAATAPLPEKVTPAPTARTGKTGKKEKDKEKAEPKNKYLPATVPVVEAAMAELKKANPDEPDLKYKYKIVGDRIELILTKGSEIRGNTGGNPGMSDISALAGLPLSALSLAGSSVSDLSPLHGMPLEMLNLNVTPVEKLEPLRGMELRRVGLEDTKVSDLGPLQGMPINELSVPPAFSDAQLSIIAKMPLSGLTLQKSQVRDLSPLKRLQLKSMNVGYCSLLRDISSLHGMPLTSLVIAGTPIENLTVLKSFDQTNLALAISARQLPGLLPLKSVLIPRLVVLGDTESVVVTDLTPLETCPKLCFLEFVDNFGASSITLTNLRPLAQLRELKVLSFKKVVIGDVSALAECRNLEELTLPPDATHVEALRKLPKLKLINDRPAAEFWKKFDAEKAAGAGGGAGKRE